MNRSSSLTIIAEIGSIHDGSFGNAIKAIDVASDAGADIVKFQTHIAEAESLSNAPSPNYFTEESRTEYFKRTSFTFNQWIKISEHCSFKGVEFISSPFSIEAIELLEKIGVKAYKVPSGEVTNLPLLEKIVSTSKDVYLSTGMSDWGEIDRAINVLRNSPNLIPMQCSSSYPCKPELVGLNVISEMLKRYNLPVGFSDHTLGFAAGISAVALGCVAVEKHFTFSKLMYGSDAKNSMEPKEFKKFCTALKEAYKMRNSFVDKNDLGEYYNMKKIFEKSIVTSQNVKIGDILGENNLAYKKPGDGISASFYKEVLGKTVNKDLSKDSKISWDDLI